MINKIKNKKGFTLMELLVVIAIIGILAVVAVPALFKNINKSKIAKVESDYNAIKSSMLNYYAENNELTSDFSKLDIDSLNLDKTPIGGDYKLRIKDSSNMIKDTSGVRTQAHKIKNDGTVDSYQNRVNLDEVGDVYLTIQGFTNKKLHINKEQFKKLIDDIGYDNLYISSPPSGVGYQTGEIYIRLANNILPKPE